MATFFYESMWNLVVFAALMFLRKRKHRPGDVTLWYFLLYGAGRLVIEGLRTDSLYAGGSIRISQLLSAVMCLAVIIIFLLRAMRSHSCLVHLRTLPMLLCAALYIGFQLYMLQSGLGGLEAITLRNALLSLTMIVSGVTLYTAERR